MTQTQATVCIVWGNKCLIHGGEHRCTRGWLVGHHVGSQHQCQCGVKKRRANRVKATADDTPPF